MDLQNVKNITIPEGSVNNIHDKDGKLLWGRLAYDTKYAGDTFQQTYSGKNLFDISKVVSNAQVVNNNDGTITINTPSGLSSTLAGQPNKLSDYCPNLRVDDIATLSFNTTGSDNYIYLYGTGANILWTTGAGNRTKTITQAMLDAQVLWYASGVGTTATISNFQIELGSTPTDYEPYVGGTASPNPDYPQNIDVVTGEQTVQLTAGTESKEFTVNLGTIELCKIEKLSQTFQDYIYKSGDDWYVHKECNKVVLNGTEAWDVSNTGGSNFFYGVSSVATGAKASSGNTSQYLLSNYGVNAAIGNNTDNGIMISVNEGQVRIRYGTEIPIADWKTKLGTTNMVLYYALATATDTKITNADLISELDDIHQFLTRYGYNSQVTGNLPMIVSKETLT